MDCFAHHHRPPCSPPPALSPLATSLTHSGTATPLPLSTLSTPCTCTQAPLHPSHAPPSPPLAPTLRHRCMHLSPLAPSGSIRLQQRMPGCRSPAHPHRVACGNTPTRGRTCYSHTHTHARRRPPPPSALPPTPTLLPPPHPPGPPPTSSQQDHPQQQQRQRQHAQAPHLHAQPPHPHAHLHAWPTRRAAHSHAQPPHLQAWPTRRAALLALSSGAVSCVYLGGPGAERATASKLPAFADSAWEAMGGGPADLYFPEQFMGVWDVTSLLTQVYYFCSSSFWVLGF